MHAANVQIISKAVDVRIVYVRAIVVVGANVFYIRVIPSVNVKLDFGVDNVSPKNAQTFVRMAELVQ